MGKDHKDSPLTEEVWVAENRQRSLFFGRGVGWKASYTPMDDHTQPHTGALIELSGLLKEGTTKLGRKIWHIEGAGETVGGCNQDVLA